tara:strand:+ start:36733 stop:37098 length:366 start_codon:yes stop_codon:yes gene_type:complete
MKTAQDIIDLIKEAGAEDAQAIRATLEDGAALLALGITDEDQQAVELAHDLIGTAKYIEKEQDWQNEATRYWFEVDGEEYAVVESGGQSSIIGKNGDDVYDRALESSLKSRLIVTDEMRAE